jgi:hypothetical protein
MIRLAACLLLALVPLAEDDPRSRVILDQDCSNEFTRRQLTLFANGTLRLRAGEGGTRTMKLAELGHRELEAYVRRFDDIRFDDLAPSSPGLDGDWVERCKLVLDLPEAESRVFEYGRYDSVPHGLRLALLIVDDLLAEVARSGSDEGVGIREFDLEIGDLLVRRRDGARFEVLGFTAEGTGVELQGLDQPTTILMLKDEVLLEFDPVDRGSRR